MFDALQHCHRSGNVVAPKGEVGHGLDVGLAVAGRFEHLVVDQRLGEAVRQLPDDG